MRIARVLGPASSNCYHIMARAIEGRMIFDDVAKEKFRALLDVHCRFAQIRLIMGNHWHALVEVPDPEENPLIEAPDSQFLDHLEILYSEKAIEEIATQLEDFRDSGLHSRAEELRMRYIRRMRDLSVFVKELQQRLPSGITGVRSGAARSGRIASRACWWRDAAVRSRRWRHIST